MSFHNCFSWKDHSDFDKDTWQKIGTDCKFVTVQTGIDTILYARLLCTSLTLQCVLFRSDFKLLQNICFTEAIEIHRNINKYKVNNKNNELKQRYQI